MSRLYEMTVEIKDYRPLRLKKIVRACQQEWDFEADDFTRDREYDPPSQKLRRAGKVIATAQGDLCGGEQDREFANRLARAIWTANGGYCQVDVHATCLEDLPYETHTYDEDEYKRMAVGRKEERQ